MEKGIHITPPRKKRQKSAIFSFKDSDFETEKMFICFMQTYGTAAAAEIIEKVKNGGG